MSLSMSEFGLPREARLRRQADFERVRGSSWYAADETLVIGAATNGLNSTRVGIPISRQVGNAVVRNRWKRLIREAYRAARPTMPAGMDLVVRPRRGAVADLQLVKRSFLQLTQRLAKRLLKEQP